MKLEVSVDVSVDAVNVMKVQQSTHSNQPEDRVIVGYILEIQLLGRCITLASCGVVGFSQ